MNYKHGLSHTRIDAVYKSMISRCFNKNNKRYKNYGLRGITVCDEWLNDKTSFFEWAFKNGYNADLPRGIQTLDRIDANKNYCPENCTFSDVLRQNNNKTNNRYVTFDSETHTIAEWERIKGFKRGTLFNRFKYGWNIDKALTTPAIVGRNQFTK